MEKRLDKFFGLCLNLCCILRLGVRERFYNGIQPEQRGGHEDGKEIRI